ncbi:hypothetical protein SSX86_005046 [Deinandra increscens subsp. villosa]|uniref:DUF4378 domain-containing protein n=1 Tax=Deinandra increscens subsp. villosa TaxID=3103831 RepID=A0AAP0DQ59_9ASTR
MAARASFSTDSRIVKMPLPNSALLKDYLLDDLSSCSSNGFRSYPRRQCCGTKVRYLIEIDLNKHVKLPPMQKQFLKSKSKSKSKSKPKLKSAPILYKASAAMITVFKKFRFSGSGSSSRKPNFTPTKNRKQSTNHCFWKRSTDQKKKLGFKTFDQQIKQKDNNILPPDSKVSAAITTTTTTAEMKTSTTNSNNSNSSISSSYFTATSISSINAPENNFKEIIEQLAMEKMNGKNAATATATAATGNAKKKLQGEEKDEFSPISVIDFPYDKRDENDQDEVTSPFKHNPFYSKGRKTKLLSEDKRTKILARLNPVRLEDRITLSESRIHGSSSLQIQQEFAAEKNAVALLQLLKATMSSHNLSESTMTKSVLLGFFKERFIEGNASNNIILQEAKDWVKGQTKEMFKSQNSKLICVKEMEKGVKWLNYKEEGTRDIALELEYEVFSSLLEEMLLDFHFIVF